MVQVKNEVIYATPMVLNELYKNKMGAITALKLAKFKRHILNLVKDIEETRMKLIKDNKGVENKELNKYIFEDEEKFANEFKELMGVEQAVKTFDLNWDMFKDIELTVNEADILSYYLGDN